MIGSRYLAHDWRAQPEAERLSILAESSLPRDLRNVLDQRTLVRMTLEAAQAGPLLAPARTEPFEWEPANRRMLLTLLVYAYASGVFGSREIEWQATQDSALGYICANQLPDWNTLRLFRRRFQWLLTSCLALVFKSAVRIRFLGEDFDELSLNEFCLRMAEARVREAIIADSIDLDE